MKKELKDYLHLYLGCECSTPVGNMFFNGINSYDIKNAVWFHCRWDDKKCRYLPIKNSMVLLKHSIVGKSFKYSEIKPILRPLSDMTEMELGECVKLHFGIENEDICEAFKTKVIKRNEVKSILKYGTSIPYTMLKENGEHYLSGTLSFSALSPEQILFLISKHFDLFGLIEAGLAIDATTLKQKS